MAKKKAHRTTMRSSSGKKLYAVRDAEGQFKDIQSYKRAQGQDMQRTSKAETAARAAATPSEPKSNVSLPGVSLPIPTPGVASQASPLTIPNLGGGKKKSSSKPTPTAKPAAKKAPAKKPAMKKTKPAAKPAAKKAAKSAPKKKKKR
jgi:hypothetical protein